MRYLTIHFVKRIVLHIIHWFFKANILEKWLVKKTQGKTYDNFFVKLIPPNKKYPPNTTRLVTRNDIHYRLDISDYMEYTLYYGLITEPREQLYSLIHNHMFVFDIGTNIGETLLNFSKLNPEGKNFGFEPVPYLFERVKANIALNKFDNILLQNIALSNQNETLFFQKPTNNNSGGIALHKLQLEGNIPIPAVTLDEFIQKEKIAKVDFIKIDVEGFEMNVLKGGERTIIEHQPVMFIELSDNNLKRQGSSSRELVKWLTNKKYIIIRADTEEVIHKECAFEDTHFDIICQVIAE